MCSVYATDEDSFMGIGGEREENGAIRNKYETGAIGRYL